MICRVISSVVLAACSSPIVRPVRPSASAAAPLSLAADRHMVAIAAGQFVAGSTPEERTAAYDDYAATSGRDTAREHKWFDGEEDRHLVRNASAYRIDLMPVTQAEYGELVSAGGAPAPAIDEATWKAQGFTPEWPGVAPFVWHDNRPPAGHEDHPVVLVTWAQAAHYCAWRGEVVGEPRRLPTADEYERAARGDNGLPYPWGNSYEASKLNSAVAGPHDTTPVGAYLAGASPYGVLDLAGNVFEWTSTPFRDGEMTVKGSAWDDFAGVGRGAGRHGRAVTARHVIVGFRCAADGA